MFLRVSGVATRECFWKFVKLIGKNLNLVNKKANTLVFLWELLNFSEYYFLHNTYGFLPLMISETRVILKKDVMETSIKFLHKST